MDRNGNTYTFIYAAVMVVLVAAVLAVAAVQLKPAQDRNTEIEKMQSVLKSVNIEAEASQAADIFKKTFTEIYCVNSKGEKVEGDAFNIDLKVEHAKPVEERKLPVFVADLGEKGKKFIIPLRGAGLWGPIWGYISLNDDLKTVFGASFGHQGETPGLGAEISTPVFQKPFEGKAIFDESGKFTSITVAKAGEIADPKSSVDAISGGTITSKALQQMLYDDLSTYQEFLKSLTK